MRLIKKLENASFSVWILFWITQNVVRNMQKYME
jgi:hypothetical protein